MKNKILIQIKNVYGVDRVYSVGNESRALRQLVGQKTLSPEHIKALKELGFDFEVKQQTAALVA